MRDWLDDHKWWLLAGLLLLAGIFSVYRFATASNQGDIAPTPATPQGIVRSAQIYDGAYIQFTYPGMYSLQKNPAHDNDLELALLTADTNYDKHLAVSVSKLPGGQLDQSSAYNTRHTRPDDYTQLTTVVDGLQSIKMLKNDHMEQTIFIPKGDKIAVLSFSTTNASDDLNTEVSGVLASFHWKQ